MATTTNFDEAIESKETFVQYLTERKRRQNWEEIFKAVMSTLVDLDRPDRLKDVLEFFHPNYANKGVAEINCIEGLKRDILKKSCEAEKHECVKVLIKDKYRPRLELPSNLNKWDWSCKARKPVSKFDVLETFRLVSNKLYLLASYEVVIENCSKNGKLDDCKCDGENGQEDFHYCPSHEDFNAKLNCTTHVECNDPIFKCFALCEEATKYAHTFLDYRENYLEIAKNCRSLAQALLDQCQTLEEASTVLEEKTGSSEYFRHTKAMNVPRLKLAAENGYKHFVGHDYCQRIFRREWFGPVLWDDQTYWRRLTHVLLMVLGSIIANFCPHILSSKMCSTTCFKWCSTTCSKLSATIPFNRFLTFSFNYLAFTIVVIYTNAAKTLNGECYPGFPVHFWFLTMFAYLLLRRNIMSLGTFKLKMPFRYLKYWRLYDVLHSLVLLVTVSLRISRVAVYNTASIHQCHDHKSHEAKLNDWEDIFLSLTTIMTMSRLVYWIQFTDVCWLGPTVINMARVLGHVISLSLIMIVIMLAFTSGIYFAMAFEPHSSQGSGSSTTPLYNVSTNTTTKFGYGKIINWVAWSIFSRGNKQKETSTNHHSVIREYYARALAALYQVLIGLILIALLSALMNFTVKKLQDHKQLYWKYYTTMIRLDFFTDDGCFLLPFSLVQIFWDIPRLFRYFWRSCRCACCCKCCCTKKSRRRRNGDFEGVPQGLNCTMKDQALQQQRGNYVRVMKKLMNKLLKKEDSLSLLL